MDSEELHPSNGSLRQNVSKEKEAGEQGNSQKKNTDLIEA